MANKYTDVELLYKEADKLRKDAYDKYKQALEGKLIVPEVSQDYLVAKTHNILQVAFAIEAYSMWIQGKPLEINFEEVQIYIQLIKLVRNRLP